MIDFYTHATPNGYKVAIALEEMGPPYEVHLVDIRQGDQFQPDFVAMSPNAKMPVIVDRDTGTTVYESNAILEYLAAKTGTLMPAPDAAEYWEARQLLYFQAASVGPMFGQRMHFSYLAPEVVPYGIKRYETEGQRLQDVMNKMLEGRDYFLASGYSIVDIAIFGWYNTAVLAGYNGDGHPNLDAWFGRVSTRPAVEAGLGVPARRDPSQLPPRKTVG